MSRRRDMTPTLERRDGQIETLMKSLAREQAKNRDLRNDLRDAQRANDLLLRTQVGFEQTIANLKAAHEERIARYQTILNATPPEPAEPARGWYQRLLAKINPT